MNITNLLNSDVFTWVVLPLLIFFSRILDVPLGTLRIIFVSRGNKSMAPILGFFEVLIWILAMGQIMQHLDNIMCYIAYAAGFSLGSFIGIVLEEKLAIGVLIVRIIIVKDECRLKQRLIDAGFGVTSVDAHGASGQVELIYSIVKRKNIKNVVEIINMCDSKAFYSIEDARKVSQGIFPIKTKNSIYTYRFFKHFAKRK